MAQVCCSTFRISFSPFSQLSSGTSRTTSSISLIISQERTLFVWGFDKTTTSLDDLIDYFETNFRNVVNMRQRTKIVRGGHGGPNTAEDGATTEQEPEKVISRQVTNALLVERRGRRGHFDIILARFAEKVTCCYFMFTGKSHWN